MARFGNTFADRVANSGDILLFKRRLAARTVKDEKSGTTFTNKRFWHKKKEDYYLMQCIFVLLSSPTASLIHWVSNTYPNTPIYNDIICIHREQKLHVDRLK